MQLSQAGGVASGVQSSDLREDGLDDYDVEDDFSKQLRHVISPR